MTAGLWYLLLAVLGFAAMGILHKLGDRLKCQPLAVVAVTMSAGMVVAAVRAGTSASSLSEMPLAVPAVALPFGICAAAALWAFQTGIKRGRIASSWLMLNLSVAVPTGLSLGLYGEAFDWKKGLALGLIAVAVVFLWLDRRQKGDEACGSE